MPLQSSVRALKKPPRLDDEVRFLVFFVALLLFSFFLSASCLLSFAFFALSFLFFFLLSCSFFAVRAVHLFGVVVIFYFSACRLDVLLRADLDEPSAGARLGV